LLMAAGAVQLWRGRLEQSRVLLWLLLSAFPFPFIANTAGWTAAELGRQPWLVYGLFRTDQGVSAVVSAGDTIFTLIGFAGLYFVVGLVYLGLFCRELRLGPTEVDHG
jgi:cytochrome bd ubiquinol oxidase subunit I